MLTRRAALCALAVMVTSACSQIPSCAGLTPAGQSAQQAAEAVSPSGRSGGEQDVVIAFLGDSLTAGLGLNSQQSFPSLIQDMFAAEGYSKVEVLNSGVSGDTTAGGLRRVDQVTGSGVRILVLALGGNDALRGLTVEQTHDNLAAIMNAAGTRGIAVLLAGMEAPTNLGPDYRDAFRAVYGTLVREQRGSGTFVPFLLEGVAGNPALNQADGIHPTAEGAKIIATNLYPKLRDMVDQLPIAR